ncbi:MAG TPA: DnaA regulatory inactivator Hda [Pseudomonadales bacterium]
MSRDGAFQFPFAFTLRTEVMFDNFVCTEANAALLHFLRGFAMSPERLAYLHGAAGSGKTHLLQALCHQEEQAVYLPLTQLRGHGASTLDGLDAFPLLVVDDLHVIAGDSEWEQGLFALFNAVQGGSGRLVFAADRPAAQLPLQLADLRSRLQLCVAFEVKEPDDAGKAEVLRRHAAQRGLELRDEAAQYILQHSARGMQALLDVLDVLDRQSLAEQRKLTLPFIKACMGW